MIHHTYEADSIGRINLTMADELSRLLTEVCAIDANRVTTWVVGYWKTLTHDAMSKKMNASAFSWGESGAPEQPEVLPTGGRSG